MKKQHILIAEYNAFFCVLVSSSLEKRGYTTEIALNGQKALDILLKSVREEKSHKPVDLLITDILMPEMGGLELIRRIFQEGIDLPIIVMTGNSDKETLKDTAELGFEDILKKPFAGIDLVQKVESFLKEKT